MKAEKRRREGSGAWRAYISIIIDITFFVLVLENGNDTAVAKTFPEIFKLAIHCRFRDCQHEGEPGCAVVAGIATGQIDVDRLDSLRRLRRELDHLDRQSDPLSAMQHKSKIKRIMRAQEQQQRRRTKP